MERDIWRKKEVNRERERKRWREARVREGGE